MFLVIDDPVHKNFMNRLNRIPLFEDFEDLIETRSCKIDDVVDVCKIIGLNNL